LEGELKELVDDLLLFLSLHLQGVSPERGQADGRPESLDSVVADAGKEGGDGFGGVEAEGRGGVGKELMVLGSLERMAMSSRFV
jgi:hypothetical protein